VVSFAPKKKVSITLDYAEITRERSPAPHHPKNTSKLLIKTLQFLASIMSLNTT